MPPIPSNQRWIARLNLFGFALFPLTFNLMTWIFFVGDVLMTGACFSSERSRSTTVCGRTSSEMLPRQGRISLVWLC